MAEGWERVWATRCWSSTDVDKQWKRGHWFFDIAELRAGCRRLA